MNILENKFHMGIFVSYTARIYCIEHPNLVIVMNYNTRDLL
jgi:hypothetical protein